jgi:hypothetical protein
MKTHGGVQVYVHLFITLAVDGGEWSASRPGTCALEEIALSTHLIEGWVGPELIWTLYRRERMPFPEGINLTKEPVISF